MEESLDQVDRAPVMTYERNRILGRGTIACVFYGTLNQVPVAVKRIQLHDLEESFQIREETAMRQLDHPNVVKLLHVEENEDFKFLVLELCEATVDDYIRRKYMGETPSDRDALHQMASGVKYIHSQGFVHRNVKPENVLITTTGVLKIADFGFCKPFRPSGSFSMTVTGPRGTRIYCAPEILQLEGRSQDDRETIRCDFSVDVFSLGCMFFCYIKKGDHPFAKPGSPITHAIASNIIHGRKYLHLALTRDHYAYEMIDGMTQAAPQDRWKLERVIEILKPLLTTTSTDTSKKKNIY